MDCKQFSPGYRNLKLDELTRTERQTGETNPPYHHGEKVWIKIPGIRKRLDKRYEGPYEIVCCKNNGTYEVRVGSTVQLINQRRLKPYRTNQLLEEEVDVV